MAGTAHSSARGKQGLTDSQVRILVHLLDHGSKGQTDIAIALGMDRSDVSGDARALAARGLVLRREGKRGQQIVLDLTTRGREIAKALHQPGLRNVSPADEEALERLAESVRTDSAKRGDALEDLDHFSLELEGTNYFLKPVFANLCGDILSKLMAVTTGGAPGGDWDSPDLERFLGLCIRILTKTKPWPEYRKAWEPSRNLAVRLFADKTVDGVVRANALRLAFEFDGSGVAEDLQPHILDILRMRPEIENDSFRHLHARVIRELRRLDPESKLGIIRRLRTEDRSTADSVEAQLGLV